MVSNSLPTVYNRPNGVIHLDITCAYGSLSLYIYTELPVLATTWIALFRQYEIIHISTLQTICAYFKYMFATNYFCIFVVTK